MTRRKFIRRLILAGAAVATAERYFARKTPPRRYTGAARLSRYPGSLRRVGRVNTIGKWSG